MLDFLLPWTFRFRGRTGRILAIAACFLDQPNKGLAPAHIAREVDMHIYDVLKILDRTRELFVKLPGRGDGITRYRLASAVAAQGKDGVAEIVGRHARREAWLLYALVLMGLLLFLVAALAIAPSIL